MSQLHGQDDPPVAHADLRALFELLEDESSKGYECDHAFTLTRRFLASRQLPVEPMIRWLGENGAGCDCEVSFNVGERWETRVGFVPKDELDDEATPASVPRPLVRRSADRAPQTARREPTSTRILVVDGDLLDQDVDVIVNAWNRNIFPWWLLLPQGVSRAIKRRAGYEPFRELARMRLIPLGGAVLTSAGKLPHKAIIHVAGINLLWRASEWSIRESVRNALALARQHGFRSVAMPLIGAGSGGGRAHKAERWILDELRRIDFDGELRVVRYGARLGSSAR